jgi:hypothetical protein
MINPIGKQNRHEEEIPKFLLVKLEEAVNLT